MKLTEHEQRWLTTLEDRLIAEEPHLHRALATLSSRPLLRANIVAAVRGVVRNPRTWLVTSAMILAAG